MLYFNFYPKIKRWACPPNPPWTPMDTTICIVVNHFVFYFSIVVKVFILVL